MSEFHRIPPSEIMSARQTRAFGGAPDLARAWNERPDLGPEDLDHIVHAEQISSLVPQEGLYAADSEFALDLELDLGDGLDAIDDGFPFELKL
jgi:hypothetical protein